MINRQYLLATTSTQDYAKELISSSHPEEDIAVLADIQTEGKGRVPGRTWMSVSGTFHCTYIINVQNLKIKEADVAIINTLALQSVQQLLCELTQSNNITAKLPNDILANNKKISGVLTEIIYPHALVGIGINLIASPLETSTDLQKEFNLLVKPEELVENLYELLASKIKVYGEYR
jgi:BirA family biotin operon repressor/biotin-[acetyl-CoA-carboxylase] ligase